MLREAVPAGRPPHPSRRPRPALGGGAPSWAPLSRPAAGARLPGLGGGALRCSPWLCPEALTLGGGAWCARGGAEVCCAPLPAVGVQAGQRGLGCGAGGLSSLGSGSHRGARPLEVGSGGHRRGGLGRGGEAGVGRSPGYAFSVFVTSGWGRADLNTSAGGPPPAPASQVLGPWGVGG